jgi:tetratricopeptide (TPR) repeat protein
MHGSFLIRKDKKRTSRGVAFSVRILILIMALNLIWINTYSQEERSLVVVGTVEQDMKALPNAKVTVYKDGKEDKTVTSGSDGVFRVEMDMNSEYLIVIEKTGMLAKRIAFNTEIPDDVVGKWTMEFAMSLFPGCEGVNTSALNDPVDRVKFSTNKNDFISDKAYVERMRGRIGELMFDIESCKQKEFQEAMSEGDRLMNSGQYEQARVKYQEALVMYPDDRAAEKRISEINDRVGEQKAVSQEYNSLIAEADGLFQAQQYQDARVKYNEALALMPQNSYPRDKVATINKMVAEEQKTLQQQEQYDNYIAKANAAENAQNYTAAKELYQQASLIKPDASLPKQKISEMEPMIAEQQQALMARQANEKSYQEAIAMGQSALQAGEYEAAKQHFNRALMLQPSQSLPREKIEEADKAIEAKYIADMRAQKASAQKLLEDALDEADNYFSQKNYEAAQAAYQKALEINPKDTYAQQRLARTNSLLSAQVAEQQKVLENAYSAAIEKGDALVAAGSYQQGIEAYKQALIHKPNDSQAMDKISQAEQQLSLQQQKLAQEEAKKQQYDQYLLEGNRLLAAGDYAQAKAAYQNALTLFPEQSVPRTRIAEADRLIAEQQKEQQFKQAIIKADGLLAAKNYAEAKTAYQQALLLKTGDSYANQKITEIDGILLKQQQLIAANEARRSQYNTLIKQGDNLYSNSQFTEAKDAYQQALNIQPGETYPASQISKIEAAIAEQVRLANQQKERDRQYNELIVKADAQLSSGDYNTAKTSYQQALALKSEETYPREKIQEIDAIFNKQQQLAEQQKARDEQFNQLIVQADNLMKASKLEDARKAYESALVIKPGESYPASQLALIESQIAEKMRLEQEKIKSAQEYNSAIAEADSYLGQDQLQQAKTAYQRALAIKPGEPYPTSRITQIDEQLALREKERQEKLAFEQKYQALINTADKNFNQHDYTNAKNAYSEALRMKPTEAYPQQQLNKIVEFERIIAQQEAARNAAIAAAASTTATSTAAAARPKAEALSELNFVNDSERDKYLNELKKKYPEGVTLEVHKDKTKTTERYVVIRDNDAREFRKVRFNWGGIDYTLNGKPITSQYFDTQVRVREGEFFQEFKY